MAKKKVIGTYRNKNIRLLLKLYQVKKTGMNRPKLRDSWNEILDNIDPPPPCNKWKAEDEDDLIKITHM